MNQLVHKSIFLAAIVCFSLVSFSCKKKGCTSKLAENYSAKAKKDDGSCTFARTKFIGSYATSQSCVFADPETFVLAVSNGPNDNEIMLGNFGNMGISIRAQVTGNDISFKEEQAGIVYEGTGYLTGNSITINYEACESYYYPCTDPESCTMTGSK